MDSFIAALDEQTRFMSSINDMMETPAYIEIKAMGRDAVPALLAALLQERAMMPVMVLLSDITGAAPVAPRDHGSVRKMREAWLNWGNSFEVSSGPQ